MTITQDLKNDALAPASNLPLILLTIDHADILEPIRVVNNLQSVFSRGDEFLPFPFDAVLPDNTETAAPRAKLRIDNVSREIGQAIRLIQSPASVMFEVIRQETPDIVEVSFPGMILRDVNYTAMTVEGSIEFEDLTREPYPGRSFTPAEYPGLF